MTDLNNNVDGAPDEWLSILVNKLAEKLPEFKVSILGPKGLSEGAEYPASSNKLSIELPASHAKYRLGMMGELRSRIGVSFHSDRRVLDGACMDLHREEDIEKLNKACDEGKFEGLTLEYLENNVREEVIARAVDMKNVYTAAQKGKKGKK